VDSLIGMKVAELKQLKEIWNLLYRSDVVMAEALEQARSHELFPAADHLCSFLEASTAQGRRGPTPVLSHR
jgi:UDP-N-acetylglucosamine acyltransferase